VRYAGAFTKSEQVAELFVDCFCGELSNLLYGVILKVLISTLLVGFE